MRLVSQGLVDPSLSVLDAVRLLTCLQGQDHPGSMLSIALRSDRRSLDAVREAYDQGQIVRAWPLRGTLFVTAAEDLEWVRALTADKTLSATERRRSELGLTTSILARAEETAREALADGGLTRAPLQERWSEAGLPVDGGRGYHLIFHLALRGVICCAGTCRPAARCQWMTSAGGRRSARRRRGRRCRTCARIWLWPTSTAVSTGWPPTCRTGIRTTGAPQRHRFCCRGSMRSSWATAIARPWPVANAVPRLSARLPA